MLAIKNHQSGKRKKADCQKEQNKLQIIVLIQ